MDNWNEDFNSTREINSMSIPTYNHELVYSKISFYNEKKIKISFRLFYRSEYFINGEIISMVKFPEDSEDCKYDIMSFKNLWFILKLDNGEEAMFHYGDVSNSSIIPASINPIKYFERKVIPDWKKKIIYERCNNKCELNLDGCTEEAEEIDHWIPVSKGGSDDSSNLRGACSNCNKKKSDKIL